MPAGERPDGKNAAAEGAGCYVYGIVPEDVELEPDARGVGEPPARVRLVRRREIAALVSEIGVSEPLRRPRDLLAHRDLLDAASAEVPVLPVRFGTVVSSPEAVEEELLGRHHDEFAAALDELDGHAEYVIEACFAGQVAGRPDEEDARAGGGAAEDAAPSSEYGSEIVDAVSGYCVAAHVRGPAGASGRDPDEDRAEDARDGADVVVLMETARQADLERALGKLAKDWDGRAGLRLHGPIAPYDFVAPLTPDD